MRLLKRESIMPLSTSQTLLVCSLSRSIAALTMGAHLAGLSAMSLAQETASGKTAIAADLFQSPPETPVQLLEAATIARQLDRQDDARKFLRKLLDPPLPEAELLALRQRVGSEPFLTLSGDRKLQPEGRELLLAVNAASKPRALSSTELQELIKKIATTGDDATLAAVTLVANGNDSAAALLAADRSTPAGRVADQLLSAHARDMRYGLLTELNNADLGGRSRILGLLGSTADPEIAPQLLRWQFDQDGDDATHQAAVDAIYQLTHGNLKIATAAEASEYLTQKSVDLLRSAADRFEHSREPAMVREFTDRNRPAELLRTATSRLADAVALDASNASASTLLLVARCAATKAALAEAPSVAMENSPADLATAIIASLELDVAIAEVELLRAMQVADFSGIDADGRELVETALKKAVNSPDPRIRMLACNVAVNVARTEISSPAVSRTLNAVRDGSLKPEAVVVDSDDRSLRNLDVALENAGFTVAVNQTGQDGFDAAVHQMNCELILVDAESAGWPLATTLANLRSDVRTRNVPIVVIGPDRFAKRVARLGQIHPGVWFMAEPVGIESLALKLESLLLPPHLLTPEDRATMKQLAGVK